MRKNNSTRLRFNLIIVALLSLYYANSQTLLPQKIESPNVSSLGKFGEIPVSLFTGVPDISIPIHTLSSGKINVPIALRYHPSSTRVTQNPGWVGTGWDLQSIGTISRKGNGNYDEYCFSNPNTGLMPRAPFYPYTCTNANLGPTGSEVLTASDWNTESKLVSYFTVSNSYIDPDVEADEFTFNFMGYSGKFYYSFTNNQWQVVCDQNVKVEITGFLEATDIFNSIKQYTQFQQNPNLGNWLIDDAKTSRWFKGFTITVPDGTKYVFGGSNAVEIESVYGGEYPDQNSGNGVSGSNFRLNTWLLKQIVDANNNVVNFDYRRNYPTVNLSFNYVSSNYSFHEVGSGFLNCSSGSGGNTVISTLQTNILDGSLIWPMYLSKISSSNETIDFLGSVSVAKRYTDQQLRYKWDLLYGWQLRSLGYTMGATGPSNEWAVHNIQWDQLDYIKIKNSNQEIISQYKLDYSNTLNQRLTLLALKEQDKNSLVGKKYDFLYDHIEDLPLYDGNYADHWGFYNGTTVHGFYLSDVISQGKRETIPQNVTKGLLQRINYPTGGNTVFTWEPHSYSKVVSTNRTSLDNISGYAGGCRISKIQNYTADNVLAGEKKYYYVKNYTSGTAPSTLASSGVLNGMPKYIFSYANRLNYNGTAVATFSIENFRSLSSYSYSGQGSYIGYDEVVTVNLDGSYTKNLFTNYGPDANSITHFDKNPDAILGWKQNEDAYYPMSSLEEERGKPVATYHYKPDNTLLQKTITTYRNDVGRFDNFIKCIDFNTSWGCPAVTIIFASARKIFNYNYYPVKVETYDYAPNGVDFVKTTTDLTYNQFDQVSSKTETNSNGESILTTYKYPADFPSDQVLLEMTNKHILSPIIETSVNSNINGLLTFSKSNYYSPFTGMYMPQDFKTQTKNNVLEVVQQIHEYDTKGNILEYSRANDIHEVILWGYNSKYPVAKIINATYSQVSPFINNIILQTPTSDDQLRSMLNSIRNNLPLAMVTSYTYRPLVGITSETDANGRTIYYGYDNFNRLIVVKDKDNNVIKKICYNYSGQPEDCSYVPVNIYYNDEVSQTFTRDNCPPGNTPGQVTYTVPLGKYSSTVNQADADGQAQAEIAANGQNYANINGTCTPTAPTAVNITAFHSISMIFYVTFMNTQTGNYYMFTINQSTSLQTLGQIPSGNYNVTINPSYGSALYEWWVGDFYEAGYNTLNLYGINITNDNDGFIEIFNY